jgi:acyl dehydratase
MSGMYLEDFLVGQTYRSAQITVGADAIKTFGAQFDPQPFHLDDDSARQSIFAGLAASGWHTAAVTMRLLVESDFRPAGGVIGAGVDELRWPRPVRPGDTLQVEGEVIEVRPSKSKPQQGVVRARLTTRNQHGEAVQVFVATLIVPRRPAT